MDGKELELMRQKIEGKELRRDLVVDREKIDAEKRTVEFSVASEFPVERFFGFEVLDMNLKSIRMERFKDGASIRDTHFGDQVAVVLKSWIDQNEKKLRVIGEFSKNTQRANEIFNDIKDGIRRNVSIRYQIKKAILEKEENDVRTYRITDWEPIHVSIEPDGADPSVGVGRSLENDEEKEIELNLDSSASLEDQVREFNEKNKSSKIKLNIQLTKNERNASMDEKELQAKIEAAKKEASEDRQKEIANILTLAKNHSEQLGGIDLMGEAMKFVQEGKDQRSFEQFILSKVNDPVATRKPNTNLGMDKSDVEKFSIRNLILSHLPNVDSKVGGYERSISEEYRRKNPSGFNRKSVISIPPDVILTKLDHTEKMRAAAKQFGNRVLNVTTGDAGGLLVADQFQAASFIELARNKTLGFQLGAQFIDGLVGDVTIPIQLTPGTVEWVDEDTAGSASDLTVGQKTATPHNATSNTSFSRNLLLQGTPAIDFIVENDLRRIIQIAADKALFQGTDANGQPCGIDHTTGVNSVNGASFSFLKAISFKTAIQIDNLDVDSMAWVTNPTIAGTLEGTEKTSGNGMYLLENNKLAGYPLYVTNQISSGNMGFGDFSQAYVMQWGGVDLIVDPYYYSTAGRIRVTIFVSLDILVRYPGAFAWSSTVAF